MQKDLEKLIDAESKAAYLFKQIELLNIIQPEKTEKDINNSIYELAFKLFGIKKYLLKLNKWHHHGYKIKSMSNKIQYFFLQIIKKIW